MTDRDMKPRDDKEVLLKGKEPNLDFWFYTDGTYGPTYSAQDRNNIGYNSVSWWRVDEDGYFAYHHSWDPEGEWNRSLSKGSKELGNALLTALLERALL